MFMCSFHIGSRAKSADAYAQAIAAAKEAFIIAVRKLVMWIILHNIATVSYVFAKTLHWPTHNQLIILTR